MIDNKSLVEKVYLFGKEVSRKNAVMGAQIGKAVIPLLKYEKTLDSISEEDLNKITGVTKRIVPYLVRIFKGESASLIINKIPERIAYRPIVYARQSLDSGNFDGSWDNLVRAYEED